MLCILAVLVATSVVIAAEDSPNPALEWKAGVAFAVIAPRRPLHMAWYAARKDPAEGPEQDLFAKALAVEAGEGRRLAIVTMDVIDYSLRLKRELVGPKGPFIWVAGYSNVYSGCILSRRVLLEGGHEARSRPWDSSLEERIIGKVHELFERLGQDL